MGAALETQFNQLRQALDALQQSMEEKLEAARREASERSDRKQVALPLQSPEQAFRVVLVLEPKFNRVTSTWIIHWKEANETTIRPCANSFKYEYEALGKYQELVTRMEADAAD